MENKGSPVMGGPLIAQRRQASTLKYLALAALIIFVVFPWRSVRQSHQQHHHHDCAATFDGKLKYRGENITWEVCGELIGRKLECSEIDVPMDHFNATNSGNKTFMVPLIRLRGNNATQNLLLNPGGPGGSGFEFLYRRGEQLNTIVGEGYHLLTFDPRGINNSKPFASCYPTKDARQSNSAVRTIDAIEDSPEDFAWSHNFVQSCVDTMGEHGKYINTPQTAADMNSILDAVGQKDLAYWGFSYGTCLGQTYATMFPERSRRVIIDGVLNNFDWYGNPLEVESMADTENVMTGFLDECIKAGKNCSLSSLAETKEELRDKILDFADALKEEPLSVYVNSTTWGLLRREHIVADAIFPALYKPATWYTLADNLAKLLKGNATDFYLAYARQSRWASVLDGESNQFVTYNDGASGAAHWPQDRKGALESVIPFLNSSLFAETFNGMFYVKQQWKVPQTHDFVPKYGVVTAHPLLILSTTFDPVCPLISARSAQAAFEGSQIVELKGYGHCVVAMPSLCIAKHVRAFLYNGTVPTNYTQCEVDGPYFVKPEEESGKATLSLLDFEDSEDQRIHRAQLEMARDSSWPYVM